MRLCIPTDDDEGLKARICEHFGSAPWFTFVDTETRECEVTANSHAHGHGRCGGAQIALARPIDAVVCRGLGANARRRLLESGVEVLRSVGGSVEDVLNRWQGNELERIERDGTCRGRHDTAAHTCQN